MAKKLIEVALPLKAINAESVREKSIRLGHPSTLHLWWARRPLAAARAVIFASLVDDPSSLPDEYPTPEAQEKRRKELFDLIEKLVKWENSNNEAVLAEAKAEIRKSVGDKPLALLDPFAGGGSIPLEAQRLGLEAHAHDLNPVAVMINKAMIEIPPKFAGLPPVHPEGRAKLGERQWKGAAGLAEDVRWYGEWMKQEAFKRIGHLYPKVKVPGGGEATAIAWIWARTVKCPNPACGCEMPLARSFVLSQKAGKQAFVQPVTQDNKIRYEVKNGKDAPEPPKTARGAKFKCIKCGGSTTPEYIKDEAIAGRMGATLMAVVAEGNNGRIYVAPDEIQRTTANVEKPENYPDGELPGNTRWFSPPVFGLTHFSHLFTPRQLTALTTFSALVKEAQQKAEQDALAAGMKNNRIPLAEGGTEAMAYGQAIGMYLAFVASKTSNRSSTLCTYKLSVECPGDTFTRQALAMSWDYAEANVVSGPSGSFESMLKNTIAGIISTNYNDNNIGFVNQCDAQSDNKLRNIIVSTDPPYYDNIGYADCSDYFYIWLRQSLKNTYPEVFRTMLVPKTEELVATPYRFGGSKEKACNFFEDGMLQTFQRLYVSACDDIPMTIYYAFKQSEADGGDGGDQQIASTGWETMLSAIIRAGFAITGTWPMRTERSNRTNSMDTNALASSIILVCRKRQPNAPSSTRRDFVSALKRELRPALAELQKANIAPVDLAQSAIGPGMGVYSRFGKVLEADGTAMSVRSALAVINQELDLFFTEQDGDLDAESRFCVDLYSQFAFNDMKFGEADVLARAKNTAVDKLASQGVLRAEKGRVRLLERAELPDKLKSDDGKILWLLTQQLTHAHEIGGNEACAEIVASPFGSSADRAKALAYRLFTIAEQKGWAAEALAYNSLVIAWPEIQAKVVEMKNVKMVHGRLL